MILLYLDNFYVLCMKSTFVLIGHIMWKGLELFKFNYGEITLSEEMGFEGGNGGDVSESLWKWNFPGTERRVMPCQLVHLEMLPFLGILTIAPLRKSSGISPSRQHLLKRVEFFGYNLTDMRQALSGYLVHSSLFAVLIAASTFSMVMLSVFTRSCSSGLSTSKSQVVVGVGWFRVSLAPVLFFLGDH